MDRLRPGGEEAGFLRDPLADAASESLYRVLAQEGAPPDCPQIWAHPGRAGWPAETRALVAQAERISALMHGAALLYNLMLSERVRPVQERGEDGRQGFGLASGTQGLGLNPALVGPSHAARRARAAPVSFVGDARAS